MYEQFNAYKDVEYLDVHSEGLALWLLTKTMYATTQATATFAFYLTGFFSEVTPGFIG